ncbi:MAG: DUF4129 domain-containing protein [Rhodoglobus sp.]
MIVFPFDVPVEPDSDEAREWLLEELAKPPYQAAKPTLFDQIAKAIQDWLGSLRIGETQGPPAVGMGVLLVVIAVAIIAAILIFGIPRLNRRSTVAGSLFGEDDARSADTMRRDAEAAAARGDYSAAIAEMFRSIARGLAERTILSTLPGTTALGFATTAGSMFPVHADRLTTAARAFDDVRYLGRAGTAEQFEQVASLEADLRSVKIALEPTPA